MERTARIEGIDADGTFEMVLATQGEASDGHILSIEGGDVPERMPLLTSHWNEPGTALGSVTAPRKVLDASPPELRAVGHIEQGGEGPAAEIRRDLAHMMREGHLGAVSVRWDEVPGKAKRRVNLPSDHPHHVAADDPDTRKRHGMFFEEWRALEGSVVAVGADPAALVQRASETEGAVREFWRSMAGAPEPDPLEALEAAVVSCRDAGATVCDLLRIVAEESGAPDHPFTRVDLEDGPLYVPNRVADLLRDDPAPDPGHPAADPQPEPTPDTAYRLLSAERIVELFELAANRVEQRSDAANEAAMRRIRGKL